MSPELTPLSQRNNPMVAILTRWGMDISERNRRQRYLLGPYSYHPRNRFSFVLRQKDADDPLSRQIATETGEVGHKIETPGAPACMAWNPQKLVLAACGEYKDNPSNGWISFFGPATMK